MHSSQESCNGRRRIVAMLAAGLSLVSALTVAQTPPGYPDRPIRFIVAYPPGGGTDVFARLVAQHISKTVGPVVIENHPGASARIGTNLAARAKPDGYTFLFAANAELVIAPSIVKAMPYVPSKDLEPITLIGSVPYFLAAHPSFGPNTLAEFVAHAKANPGKLGTATMGTASANHLLSEQFNEVAGISTVHVGYAGSAPQMTALLGGHVNYAFLTPYPLELVKAGKLKVIAVASPRRSERAPDTPTFPEAGMKEVSSGSWFGILAPVGTPRGIMERIRTEAIAATKTPEFAKVALERDMQIQTGTPAEFRQYMADETAKWQRIVTKIGLTSE